MDIGGHQYEDKETTSSLFKISEWDDFQSFGTSSRPFCCSCSVSSNNRLKQSNNVERQHNTRLCNCNAPSGFRTRRKRRGRAATHKSLQYLGPPPQEEDEDNLNDDDGDPASSLGRRAAWGLGSYSGDVPPVMPIKRRSSSHLDKFTSPPISSSIPSSRKSISWSSNYSAKETLGRMKLFGLD